MASGLHSEKHLSKVFVAFDDVEAVCKLVRSLSSDNPRYNVKCHFIMRQLKGKTKVSQRYLQQASHSIKRAGNGVWLNDYEGCQPVLYFRKMRERKKSEKKSS